ncbi:hypothetical protein PIROE2DRAFT_19219 [Piromyces sp. E2]|nr:hypothetical protein PIROE2DRAFT_19219 [Piromyces sp. E2]|eukprot:OUM56249.1 hypothetical protein PIROE2DRAFT_19219 [Piromyces sp. E2]
MKFSSSFIFCIFAALVSSKAVKDSTTTTTTTTTEEKNYSPTFSLNSGFYKKDKIRLKIKNADPKAVIYYTLDGSMPTLNSTIYKKPIVFRNRSLEDNVLSAINTTAIEYIYPVVGKVRKGNVIRAMAQLSDGSLTDVVSKTYFVDNLFDYEKGIYVLGKKYDDDPENLNRASYAVEANYSMKGKEAERPATIEYIPGHDNIATLSQDVVVKPTEKRILNLI